jgi:hypothetical protein
MPLRLDVARRVPRSGKTHCGAAGNYRASRSILQLQKHRRGDTKSVYFIG